jgi:hypothetical protein
MGNRLRLDIAITLIAVYVSNTRVLSHFGTQFLNKRPLWACISNLEAFSMSILTPMTENGVRPLPGAGYSRVRARQGGRRPVVCARGAGSCPAQATRNNCHRDLPRRTISSSPCAMPPPHTDVGMLWFAAQERAGKHIAYVYDVYILTAHQRKGHATRAFAALDDLARERGLSGVALHVFGHNVGAQTLYPQAGLPDNQYQYVQTTDRCAMTTGRSHSSPAGCL